MFLRAFLRFYVTLLKIIWLLAGFVVNMFFSPLFTRRCKDDESMIGKTALVTGGTHGMGYEIAMGLARRRFRVLIAAIDDGRECVKKIIKETKNPNVFYIYLDLGSLESVRHVAKTISDTEDRLDVLINNAGVWEAGCVLSRDKLPQLMQVNHLGPFLLTHLLADLLKKSAPSRIVFQSSFMSLVSLRQSCHELAELHDFKFTFANNMLAYTDSKLCNIVASKGFAKLLRSHGVMVNSTNPGMVMTSLQNSVTKNCGIPSVIRRLHGYCAKTCSNSAETGAQTAIYLSVSREVENVTGKHFHNCEESRLLPIKANNADFCKHLWKSSEQCVKLSHEERLGNPFDN